MAFLDNLGQKAKDIAESSKINSMISDEEKKITDTYCKLGKLYVASHPDDYEDTFAEMIASICEANERVAEYRKRLQDLKGIIRCAKCGAEVPNGAAFCSICGEPIPKIQEAVDVRNLVKCDSCGAFVRKGMRFCTACGKPMTPTAIRVEKNAESICTGVQVRLCPRCGASVAEDAVFCTACGEPIERMQNEDLVRCERCGAVVAQGVRFCTACGQPMSPAAGAANNAAENKAQSAERRCPNCGTVITDDSLFCTECGAAIPQVAAQEDGMATCHNCGAVIPREAAFCTACGTPMKQQADEADTEYIKEAVVEEKQEIITEEQKPVAEAQNGELPASEEEISIPQ